MPEGRFVLGEPVYNRSIFTIETGKKYVSIKKDVIIDIFLFIPTNAFTTI